MDNNISGFKGQFSFKDLNIVIVGDTKVGKSALLGQIVCPGNKNLYEPTIAVDYQLKEYKSYNLNFWDVSGSPYFESVRQKFYEKVSVFLVVFDTCCRNSFENLTGWINEIEKFGRPETRFVICGNKVDLITMRQVPEDEGALFANLKEFSYFEVSCVTGQGVKDMVEKIVGWF